MEVPTEDLFQIQDRVAHAVLAALSVPISSKERRLLQRDVPANPEAYGLYLRANRLIDSTWQLDDARALYSQAVELDPQYAPAWARLGRCLRLLGKYGEGHDAPESVKAAERAFAQAFDLNPDLSIAHNLYTYAEVDSGRAESAMTRLLARLRHRSSDPELYAGLVHACRYCGLIDASIAADAHARRLDPAIITSVPHTFFANGEFDKAMARDTDNPPYLTLLALAFTGHRSEALAKCLAIDMSTVKNPLLAALVTAFRAMLENRLEDGLAAMGQLEGPGFTDPEGWFYWAHLKAGLGRPDEAIAMLQRAVDASWSCANAIERSPGLATLHGQPGFSDIVARARRQEAAAARAFAIADGPRLLGLHPSVAHS
jgi:eukaryotic-like serine/threonine-protein kinase